MDPDLLGMIQELYRRVKSLERTEVSRYTSLRIGHLVLEQVPALPAEPTHLRITNIKTGTITDVPV
jgi:hypothetical protein